MNFEKSPIRNFIELAEPSMIGEEFWQTYQVLDAQAPPLPIFILIEAVYE